VLPPGDAEDVLTLTGTIKRCIYQRPDKGSKSSVAYIVRYNDGDEETLGLDAVDKALKDAGDPVAPIKCLEAVAASAGYGPIRGPDGGLVHEFFPAFANPALSDAAAQVALSNSIFRDTIMSCATLSLVDGEDMTSAEWLRLLALLVTKCASNVALQDAASELENRANEEMADKIVEKTKINAFYDIMPKVTDDERSDNSDNESEAMEVDATETAVEGEFSDEAEFEIENSDDEAALVEAIPVAEVEAVVEVQPEHVAAKHTGRETPSVGIENAEISKEDLRTKQLEAAKADRQRAVEDCYVASAIKQVLKPTVASFEEDAFTAVVESSLASKDKAVTLSSCRTRGLSCDLCGLADSTLGLPLMRVPNQREWLESIQHVASNRSCRLVAEIESPSKEEDHQAMDVSSAKDDKLAKLVSVTIRLKGELVSKNVAPMEDEGQTERGMLEFLPRNPIGMQRELRRLAESEDAYITGSLSAHECCAVAAHQARKNAMVGHYRDVSSMIVEKDASASCGRTLPLGFDKVGRAYFMFQSDEDSLFVMDSDEKKCESKKQWHRFTKAEDIACVIACLSKECPSEELEKRYPKAAKLARTHRWADLIQKRALSTDIKQLENATFDSDVEMIDLSKDTKNGNKADQAEAMLDSNKVELVDPEDAPYVEGEEVMVESPSGKLLWDAAIIAVSKDKNTERVNGYRVHYREWSSRFDEWVAPPRVVEPSEHNILCQSELLEEHFAIHGADGVPKVLEDMAAASHVHRKKRARGCAPLPNFRSVMLVGPGASAEDEAIAQLKASLLLIESALPQGSVDTSKESAWGPNAAASWRSMVREGQGPGSLMGCILLLESSISPDFFELQGLHLLSYLQTQRKMVIDASYSAAALRISVLDRAIKYGTTASKSSRKKR
jgi:hypothetical protein